jgi:hypothetical protein
MLNYGSNIRESISKPFFLSTDISHFLIGILRKTVSAYSMHDTRLINTLVGLNEEYCKQVVVRRSTPHVPQNFKKFNIKND